MTVLVLPSLLALSPSPSSSHLTSSPSHPLLSLSFSFVCFPHILYPLLHHIFRSLLHHLVSPVPRLPPGQEQNVTVQYFVYVCTSETISIAYQAVILVWLFMLQVVGIVLAFETRKVKIKVLNDAKYVTVIIYVCSIVLVVYILATLALSSYLHSGAVLINSVVLIGSYVFLGLNFIPKVCLCMDSSHE